MAPYIPFVPTEAFAIATEEEWRNAIFQNVNVSDKQAALLQTVTANAAESTTGRVRDWIGRLTLEISRHYDGYLQSLLREVKSLHITVQNQQALVDSYKRQVDALPASTGSGHSRQPKIGEPPAFKGSEDKTKLEEWLDLIVLWCEHEGVATDKQRIVTALSKLQGPAHQYMKSYYVKMREGKDLGTWKAFVAELAQIYGQRDDKECRDLRSSDWGKPNSWGRPTDSYRSDGELRSNLRLGTSNILGQEVETGVPRAAEAGLYTGEVKGRLCALHADAAPGAVDSDASISGK
ncbi:predicted protein [Postia placenta Mad-698-R]|nr:predicted protein [Postia placenta Mad-698-R]